MLCSKVIQLYLYTFFFNFLSYYIQFSSVAQSCLTLWLHESQHARPPCPSPTTGVYSNSCPSGWWCHPAISSSVAPFLLPPSIFPSIRVFANESALFIRWPSPKRWCCESAALNMPTNFENSAMATGLEKVSVHSNPKEGPGQRMLTLLCSCAHFTG